MSKLWLTNGDVFAEKVSNSNVISNKTNWCVRVFCPRSQRCCNPIEMPSRAYRYKGIYVSLSGCLLRDVVRDDVLRVISLNCGRLFGVITQYGIVYQMFRRLFIWTWRRRWRWRRKSKMLLTVKAALPLLCHHEFKWINDGSNPLAMFALLDVASNYLFSFSPFSSS